MLYEIVDGKFRENFPRHFPCGSQNFLSLFSSHLAKLEGSLLVLLTAGTPLPATDVYRSVR